MIPANNSSSIFVATLGGQPQVVTFALDALLAQDVSIKQLVVLYLSPQQPRIQASLAKLAAEFEGNYYHYGQRPLIYHPSPITTPTGIPLPDITTNHDTHMALTYLNYLIATLKQQKFTLHIGISGGRRLLSLLLMSVLNLNGDNQDKLWHMYTPEAWQTQAHDGALMHLPPTAPFQLLELPMMAWGDLFPQFRQLPTATAMPNTNPLSLYHQTIDQDRCQQVFSRLTPRQQTVLRAFAQPDATPTTVSQTLHIARTTVDSHKRHIFHLCREVWHTPENARLTYHFLQEHFYPFFNNRNSPRFT